MIYNGLDAAPYVISNIPYHDNKLVVKGYRDGAEIFEKSCFTPEKGVELRVTADHMGVDLRADGNDIVVVHAEVLDANGTRVRDYEGDIKFSVVGDASVVGENTSANTNPVPAWDGKGSALIRSGNNAGKIVITATSEGLKSGSTSIESVESCRDMIASNAYSINDNETMLVDLGGSGQLLQFGWTAWNCADQKNEPITIMQNKLANYVAGDTPSNCDVAQVVDPSTPGAYTFSLKPRSKDAVLRWLGEMNVIGQNGFVYGDGVLVVGDGGFDLNIESLPEGDYTLRSYHHAPSSNSNSMDPTLERLKSERIPQIPYAKEVNVSVNGDLKDEAIPVSSGKSRQYGGASTSFVEFTVDKRSKGSVTIHYESNDSNSGVWLNAFELKRKL